MILADIGDDPDDQQSLIRLVLYADVFDIAGLITIDKSMAVQSNRRVEHHLPDNVLGKMFVCYSGNTIKLPEKFQPEAAFLKYHRREVYCS